MANAKKKPTMLMLNDVTGTSVAVRADSIDAVEIDGSGHTRLRAGYSVLVVREKFADVVGMLNGEAAGG